MALFRRNNERKERDQREARMLLRLHGPAAIRLLDERIGAAESPRHRAHWKRVQTEARLMVDEYRDKMASKDKGRPTAH